MKRPIAFGLAFIAIALAGAADQVHAQQSQQPAKATLRVVGEALAAGPPDIAVVTVGVLTQAAQAKDALAENSKAMTQTIAAAKQAGVTARDLETTHVSVRPRYSNPPQGTREAPRIVGYEASNQVSVRVRDIAELGALIDQLVAVGANQLRGIAFSVDNPDPLRDQARVAAMKDARRKAEMLADAAGVRIVRVLAITDEASDARPMGRTLALEARPSVPIEAGEQEFRARVSAVFEIEGK